MTGDKALFGEALHKNLPLVVLDNVHLEVFN